MVRSVPASTTRRSMRARLPVALRPTPAVHTVSQVQAASGGTGGGGGRNCMHAAALTPPRSSARLRAARRQRVSLTQAVS